MFLSNNVEGKKGAGIREADSSKPIGRMLRKGAGISLFLLYIPKEGFLMNEGTKTKQYILCALFIAFSAICAQLVIPIQPVPITLGTLAILMAGAMLGPKYGALSVFLYVLLGLVGVPVFSMGRAGVGIIAGPSGGFVMGWVLVAAVTGYLAEKLGRSYVSLVIAMLAGTIVCYVTGVAWFMFLTGTGLWAALVACMFPFLIGDSLKIVIGAFLVRRCRDYI